MGRIRSGVFLLLSLFLMMGCGQKGALYMPSTQPTRVKPASQVVTPLKKPVKKHESQQQKPSQH